MSVKRSAILVGTLALISAFFGFGRETYIAYAFGATGTTDAYYVAMVIPDWLANWVAYSFTTALIPVLKEELAKSRISAQRLATVSFITATLFLVLMCLFVYITIGISVKLLAPGFTSVEYNEAVNLLKIMTSSILFSGLVGILSGIHNANENYFFPALNGIVNNGIMLGTAMLLANRLRIEALAYAFLAGTLGRFFIQISPFLIRRKLQPIVVSWHPQMSRIYKLIPPVFISTGLGTVSLIVDRILSSQLPSGQISDLNFASKLGLLPVGVIGMSLATTIYTRYVKYTSEGNLISLRNVVANGSSWMVFIGISICSVYLFFSREIVSVLFYHGAFTIKDLIETSKPVQIFALFQIFYLLQPILTHFFYARKDNYIVTRSSLISVGSNIIGSVLLVHYLGIVGLVLANGFSQLIYVVLLIIKISRLLKLKIRMFVYEIIELSLIPGLLFMIGIVTTSMFWHISYYSDFSLDIYHCVVGIIVGALLLTIYSIFFRKDIIGVLLRKGSNIFGSGIDGRA